MKQTSISDFKKEKVIGKGSFGSVYLVRRIIDNQIYALKTVILEKLNKKEQENSVNEVRILASIKNPYVIGYKEAFWNDKNSSLNIVMEYADDGDLQTKIIKMRNEGGYFKENIIWEYAIQMIEGLKALHDKKIMHRDLKSANIFLFKKNHICKLGDMNVSKVIKEKVLLTQTGTPYYASPEVWRDEPYSYKSDLWSIGCVIYELCEQHPPFMGKNLDELFENVCKGKPQRINKIYSDELWKVIMMLLQTDVDKRVDCDSFLNNKTVKDKIKEINKNLGTLNNNNTNNDKGVLLNTIKFNNLNELKYQLPSEKNYSNNNNNYSNNNKENKENYNINNINIHYNNIFNNINNDKKINCIKNPTLKKISIKNKYSRNKIMNSEENKNNKEGNKKRNNILMEKLQEIQIKNEIMKYKLNIPKKDNKLYLMKNRSKRDIYNKDNSKNKLLIYNNFEISDNNIVPINKLKNKKEKSNLKYNKLIIKGRVKSKDNLKIKIPINPKNNTNNIITNKPPIYNVNINKKNSKINYYNNILKNFPISTSSSNINRNHVKNSLSLDISNDLYKQLNSITQNIKNNCNLIPKCNKLKIKNKKVKKDSKIKLIKRKSTYTKDNKDLIKNNKIKQKIEIAPLLIKRNKSLNLDLHNNNFKKIKKHKIKKKELNLNSLNIKNINNNLSSHCRQYNSISNILNKDTSFNSANSKSQKNNIKQRFHYHQRYPTISSVNHAVLNNFNNYRMFIANIRNKKGINHKKTLSIQLHKNNIINNYKKNNLNYNKRRIKSFSHCGEKSINSFDFNDKNIFNKSDVNNKINGFISPKLGNSQIFNNYYSFNNIESTNIPVKVINIYKK